MKKVKTTYWEQTLRGLPKEIECEDKLQKLIDQMNHYVKTQAYGDASDCFEEIKKLLHEDFDPVRTYDSCRTNGRTLLAIHDILRSNIIRLDYSKMNISLYLKLLENLDSRLQGNDTIKFRKIVAEEMVKIGLGPQEGRGRKAPNRAFIDELFKVKPTLATPDLKRREQTKLWYAMKHGNEEEKQEAKEMMRKIREAELQ